MSLKGGLCWLPMVLGLSEKGREGIGRSRSSLDDERSFESRRNQEDMIKKEDGKNGAQELSI